MNSFEGPIDACVTQAWENPELIQALDISKYDESTFLSKLLNEEPDLYKLLQPSQYNEEVYEAMLKSDVSNYDFIPKAKRNDDIKLKALALDECSFYLFSPEEVSYECVKYLFMNAPYVLEELPKNIEKAIKPHMKRIKKEKLVSTYNEEDDEIEQLDPDDLPDYEDEE